MKKILLLLSFIIIFFPHCRAADERYIDDIISQTAQYLQHSVTAPQIGAVGGEWTVIGLSRSGAEVPAAYYSDYLDRAQKMIKECGGVLHRVKHTEYSRVVLALTALGENPENFAGYNLITPLLDYEKTLRQGLNGPIWALIALDSAGYGSGDIREKYISFILSRELEGGGFALTSGDSAPDTDVTAMAITALSEYTDRQDVKATVYRALDVLSSRFLHDGGFSDSGTESSESVCQVLTALCSLGISYDDARFIKDGNTLLENLLAFRTHSGAFSHLPDGDGDIMATEQALYALSAVKRLRDGDNKLFDIRDSDSGSKVKIPIMLYPEKSFDDIASHKNRQAIQWLCKRGIVNGMTERTYCPDSTMSRAEFAAITVRALGLPICASDKFADVTADKWFYGYVSSAYENGIVMGISQNCFAPDAKITREQACVMLTRAERLADADVELDGESASSALGVFTDIGRISPWAYYETAFCAHSGVTEKDSLLRPQDYITRGEMAQMLYNLIKDEEKL